MYKWKRTLMVLVLLLFNVAICACGGKHDTQILDPKNNNSQDLNISVDSYKSDQLKKLGYDLTIQGIRFPIPTTLNELGEEWSFNSGDINDRESGSYNGQRYWRAGNIYTAEWYKAGTKFTTRP